MAQHRDLASDDLATDTTDRPSMMLARVLSIVFSPPLVAIATYVLVAILQPPPITSAIGWVLLSLAVQMLPGVFLYIYRRQTGTYRDADVSVRQDRNELYLIGSIAVLCSLLLLNKLGAPRIFVAMATCTLGLGIACGLVNLVWKISMHATAIGTLATIGAIVTPALGAALWICALAVGWARVKTRNHSPLQVVAGLAVSAIVTIGAFTLVGT